MYPNAAGKIVSNVPFKGKVGAPPQPSPPQLAERTRPSCMPSLALPATRRCTQLHVAGA